MRLTSSVLQNRHTHTHIDAQIHSYDLVLGLRMKGTHNPLFVMSHIWILSILIKCRVCFFIKTHIDCVDNDIHYECYVRSFHHGCNYMAYLHNVVLVSWSVWIINYPSLSSALFLSLKYSVETLLISKCYMSLIKSFMIFFKNYFIYNTWFSNA